MAKPIKETPYLTGKDAKAFIDNSKKTTKIDSQSFKAMMSNFEKISSISKK